MSVAIDAARSSSSSQTIDHRSSREGRPHSSSNDPVHSPTSSARWYGSSGYHCLQQARHLAKLHSNLDSRFPLPSLLHNEYVRSRSEFGQRRFQHLVNLPSARSGNGKNVDQNVGDTADECGNDQGLLNTAQLWLIDKLYNECHLPSQLLRSLSSLRSSRSGTSSSSASLLNNRRTASSNGHRSSCSGGGHKESTEDNVPPSPLPPWQSRLDTLPSLFFTGSLSDAVDLVRRPPGQAWPVLIFYLHHDDSGRTAELANDPLIEDAKHSLLLEQQRCSSSSSSMSQKSLLSTSLADEDEHQARADLDDDVDLKQEQHPTSDLENHPIGVDSTPVRSPTIGSPDNTTTTATLTTKPCLMDLTTLVFQSPVQCYTRKRSSSLSPLPSWSQAGDVTNSKTSNNNYFKSTLLDAPNRLPPPSATQLQRRSVSETPSRQVINPLLNWLGGDCRLGLIPWDCSGVDGRFGLASALPSTKLAQWLVESWTEPDAYPRLVAIGRTRQGDVVSSQLPITNDQSKTATRRQQVKLRKSIAYWLIQVSQGHFFNYHQRHDDCQSRKNMTDDEPINTRQPYRRYCQQPGQINRPDHLPFFIRNRYLPPSSELHKCGSSGSRPDIGGRSRISSRSSKISRNTSLGNLDFDLQAVFEMPEAPSRELALDLVRLISESFKKSQSQLLSRKNLTRAGIIDQVPSRHDSTVSKKSRVTSSKRPNRNGESVNTKNKQINKLPSSSLSSNEDDQKGKNSPSNSPDWTCLKVGAAICHNDFVKSLVRPPQCHPPDQSATATLHTPVQASLDDYVDRATKSKTVQRPTGNHNWLQQLERELASANEVVHQPDRQFASFLDQFPTKPCFLIGNFYAALMQSLDSTTGRQTRPFLIYLHDQQSSFMPHFAANVLCSQRFNSVLLNHNICLWPLDMTSAINSTVRSSVIDKTDQKSKLFATRQASISNKSRRIQDNRTRSTSTVNTSNNNQLEGIEISGELSHFNESDDDCDNSFKVHYDDEFDSIQEADYDNSDYYGWFKLSTRLLDHCLRWLNANWTDRGTHSNPSSVKANNSGRFEQSNSNRGPIQQEVSRKRFSSTSSVAGIKSTWIDRAFNKLSLSRTSSRSIKNHKPLLVEQSFRKLIAGQPAQYVFDRILSIHSLPAIINLDLTDNCLSLSHILVPCATTKDSVKWVTNVVHFYHDKTKRRVERN